MILICYDGSDDAKAAIVKAARLFERAPVTVLTVWQPAAKALLRSSGGRAAMAGALYAEETDRANQRAAERCAAEGAQLAREAGLDARPAAAQQRTSVAAAILGLADELGAGAIVMGSRGRGGVRSMVWGSASRAVLQHANRTVIVVPTPSVARARASRRHHLHRPVTQGVFR